MNKLSIKAPAKLNLHLQVLGERSDGYHDISSYFSFINFFDVLDFYLIKDEIVLNESPPINNNLVLQAAELIRNDSNSSLGVKINLSKNIPQQKGLGGGSSDAAATLIALNKMWNLNYSKQELQALGLKLGSDIPFFINGYSCWSEGRGEIFSSLELKESWFLLFFPETKISTKIAFDNLNITNEAVISKDDFLKGKRINSFTEWARENYRELDILFQKLELLGNPQLTGTGSAIFMECDSKQDAESKLINLPEAFLVKSLDHSPLLQILE
jgi:4-diphosphocytidyl-2-C-methyl-D-erythritol kinase